MKNFREMINRFNKLQHAANVAKEANRITMSQPKPTPTEPVVESTTSEEIQNIEALSSTEEQSIETPLVEKPKRKNRENQNPEVTV